MSDDLKSGDDLPRAASVRRRWPGLVWAIPLAALIIVAFLGVRAFTRRGVDVTVQFDYAEGVTPSDTKVLENGVEIGHVSNVRISKDGRHVDVTLSLDPRTKASLNSNTMFWLIGENPTISDIQSIRAAVAGVIIAMAPGTGGEPTRDFKGLGSPPLVPPGTKGTTYYLEAQTLGSVQPGAAINYRGLAIGKILSTAMTSPGHFRFQSFVNSPYDRLVGPRAQFWMGSPLKFSLSGGSISAGLSSPASVLQGAVEFDEPEGGGAASQAPAGTHFALYNDQSDARQGVRGPEMPYKLLVRSTAGDLAIGSDVKLLGYTIGRVTSARLRFAAGQLPFTEAGIVIYPSRLDVALPATAPTDEWRGATDHAINLLLARGYRAQLSQSPPFVGARIVTLAAAAHAGPARLGAGAVPLLPVSEAGGTTDDILTRANSILTKVDQVPIAQIGANLRTITANFASPKVKDSIAHLDASLQQLDQIMHQVKPQIGPLMKNLNQTADQLQGTAAAARTLLSGEGAPQDRSLPDAVLQLGEAARSIRTLTDYLGRHPEALIRGKAKEKK